MVSATPSDETPKTILLRGNTTPHSERQAGEAGITPGMLLNVNSDGKFIKHATAAGVAQPVFARENSLVGGSIDTVYDADDTVLAWHPRSGDWIYAFVEEEAQIAIGDLLESGGGGALQEGTTAPIARALEAVNTQTVSGPVRIRVEIM